MKDYTMLNSEQFFFFSKYITYILEFFRFWFEVMVAKMLIFQNLKSKCLKNVAYIVQKKEKLFWTHHRIVLSFASWAIILKNVLLPP